MLPPLSSPRGKKPLGKRTGRGTPLSSTLPDLSNAYRFLLRYLFPSWLLVRLVSRLSSAEMILRNSPLPTTPHVSVFAEWRNDDTSDDGGCETIFIRMASRTKWNRNVRRLFLGVCVYVYIHTRWREFEKWFLELVVDLCWKLKIIWSTAWNNIALNERV